MSKKKGNREGEGEGDYEIGYKKPPKRGQFKKGQSGNPAGRRKKRGPQMPDMKASLTSALSEVVAVKGNGKNRNMTKMDLLIIHLVNKAASGGIGQLRLLLPFLAKLMETSGADGGHAGGNNSDDLKKELDAILSAVGVDDQATSEVAEQPVDGFGLPDETACGGPECKRAVGEDTGK